MRTIHKHRIESGMLDPTGGVTLGTGANPEVIHIAAQRDEDELPTVWIECDPGKYGGLTLMVVPTGGEVPDSACMRHVGSAVCRWGQLVWHLYTPGEAGE